MRESINADFYNADSITYEETRFATKTGRSDHDHLMKLIHGQLSNMDLSDVIEVGVGTGRISREIRSLSDGRLRCVDISTQMLDVARASAPEPIPEYIEGSAYQLPIDNDQASAFVSVNLLSHLDDLDQFWQEAVRVTRPGGQILVTSTNLTSVFFPFGVAANRRGKAYGQAVHTAWHRLSVLRSAAENAGASIVDVDGEIYLPRALDRGALADPLASPFLRAMRASPKALRSAIAPMTVIRAALKR